MYKDGMAVAALVLAGCTAPQQESGPVGMSNPASDYCIKIGGTLAIQEAEGGQIGMCTLPDGTRIEEWALFRRDHPKP